MSRTFDSILCRHPAELIKFGNIAFVFHSAERVLFVQYELCFFFIRQLDFISALRKYLRFFDDSFAVTSHLRCDARPEHFFISSVSNATARSSVL